MTAGFPPAEEITLAICVGPPSIMDPTTRATSSGCVKLRNLAAGSFLRSVFHFETAVSVFLSAVVAVAALSNCDEKPGETSSIARRAFACFCFQLSRTVGFTTSADFICSRRRMTAASFSAAMARGSPLAALRKACAFV